MLPAPTHLLQNDHEQGERAAGRLVSSEIMPSNAAGVETVYGTVRLLTALAGETRFLWRRNSTESFLVILLFFLLGL